jgi:hypothetical protein
MTARGWEQLLDDGFHTVVDLRNPDERTEDSAPRPDSIETVLVPLDESSERDFWREWEDGPQFGTPLYYGPHLERFPERNAEAIAAVANARPGGVAFQCVGGRDRSGQVAMLILSSVGVGAEEIAADYALSAERLPARYAARGEEDQGPILDAFLREQGRTAPEVILETLATVDIEDRLRAGGLTDTDLDGLRRRLL